MPAYRRATPRWRALPPWITHVGCRLAAGGPPAVTSQQVTFGQRPIIAQRPVIRQRPAVVQRPVIRQRPAPAAGTEPARRRLSAKRRPLRHTRTAPPGWIIAPQRYPATGIARPVVLPRLGLGVTAAPGRRDRLTTSAAPAAARRGRVVGSRELILRRPGPAEIADPVVIGVPGKLGFHLRLASAPTARLRLTAPAYRQRPARVVSAERSVTRPIPAVLGVGPPQFVLILRPSHCHAACYS
jgi:hypothetical protein